MHIPYCEDCGSRIHAAADVDVCGEPHDSASPVFLHADCPCPEHGWGGDRDDYANADAPQ